MFSPVEHQLPSQEGGWDIYITENLKKLNIVNHDKTWIDKKVKQLFLNKSQGFKPFLMQPNQNNSKVGWDQFRIQKIESVTDEEKPFTEHLSSCYALAAQIYCKNELSHIGLAHCTRDLDLPRLFFQKINEATENKYSYINLFICGGSSLTSASEDMDKAIKEAVQNVRDVRVVHDVSKKLYKNVSIEHDDAVYSGSMGIKEVGFDDNSHPRICVDVQIEGLNLEKLFSSPENRMQCGFY